LNGYLLDTNVLSEILKKSPEPKLVEKLRSVPTRAIATSAVCVTELRYGAARYPARAGLWERISHEVLARVRVIAFGEAEAVRAGDLLALLESRGVPIGTEDVLIGATALEAGLSVVTRNVRHFERIPGLKVESWWP
jgi:predicted nucleic acid-binding protein